MTVLTGAYGAYLITTYVADPNLWEVDFKTRRKP